MLAGDDERARARIDLERGRLRHSRGNREDALPLFESAFAIALEAGELFIAADAAHMAALAARTVRLSSRGLTRDRARDSP